MPIPNRPLANPRVENRRAQMPENSPCDSSEVAEGKPKFLDVLRRRSSSLLPTILPPGIQFKGERSYIVEMLRSKANRGKSCIEELLDGGTNIQSHGKRSHEQIWGGDLKRKHLAKRCAELLRPAEGSIISNRILEMQLPTGSSHLQYGKHQQVDKNCPTPSGVVCDICGRLKEEGLRILTQYNKEICSKMPWEDKPSTDIYSDPPATGLEDESGKLEESNRKAGDIHGSLDRGMSGHPGFEDFTMRNDAKLQAKIGNIKSLACVNFSSIRGEELLKFVCRLGKVCMSIGMDFNLEPVMLVSMKYTDDVDIDDGLSIVPKFYDSGEKVEAQNRFVLVILPDSRCSDERVDKVCRLTRLPYHCCLPLDARKPHIEYLKKNADEIKIKVIGLKDKNLREHRDVSEDEVGDDDTSEDEMGFDDTSEDEMEGYGCDDTSKDAAEGSATITATLVDANPQAKSVGVESWACLNFSRIRNKDALRFLCTIGDTCMSIGMNLTPEPTLVIHKKYTFDGMLAGLYTVQNLFCYRGTDEGKKLLLVILPEDRSAKDAVVDACQSFGFLYQCCLPHRVRMASEKYFKYAANKMKAKVLGCYTPPCPDEDISQDDDLKEIWDLDEDIEDGSKNFDNSDGFRNLYGEHDKSEKLSASDEI